MAKRQNTKTEFKKQRKQEVIEQRALEKRRERQRRLAMRLSLYAAVSVALLFSA